MGARLRDTRVARRLSQRALSDGADVPLPTLQSLEADLYSPNLSTLSALAGALRVSVCALLPPQPASAWELVARELDLTQSEARRLTSALVDAGHLAATADELVVRQLWQKIGGRSP